MQISLGICQSNLSLVVRKRVFGVSDLVRHKPGCTVTEKSKRIEMSDLGSSGIVLSMQRNKKTLIGFAVTAKLICVFVFAYTMQKSGFLIMRLI